MFIRIRSQFHKIHICKLSEILTSTIIVNYWLFIQSSVTEALQNRSTEYTVED